MVTVAAPEVVSEQSPKPDEPEDAARQERRAALATALVDTVPRAARVPTATYRLQINPGFTFRDAEAVVPYLADLGAGDAYASPYLKASPESTHGYDVTDYGALNPAIGSEADHAAFVAALRRRRMGHLFDFVPNHMGVAGGANAWWQDVLENGRGSPHAPCFDIDWTPLKPELRGKVLLPILGDHYGAVLERGELELRFDPEAGTFTVWYWATPLPVSPPSYATILRPALPGLEAMLPVDDGHLLEFQSILTALERLPGSHETDPALVAERQREQIVAKRRLAELVGASEPVRDAVEAATAALAGNPADPRSYDALDALLELQSYRLASWRVAAEEINYRRFFAINELAAIRQEEPAVFAAAHGLLLRLLGDGAVTGVRIDHPDGLLDPAGYARDLQLAYGLELARRAFDALPEPERDGDAWDDLAPAVRERLATAGPERPLFVVVEKILEHGEELPSDWAVAGTVGYEFARATTGLFVDPVSRKAFDDVYGRFVAAKPNFGDLVYENKKLIMRVALASEVNVLARALNRISEQNRRSRDYTLNNLRDALRELIACFPVYRTYIDCVEGIVAERDRRTIEAATATAKRRNPASDPSVLDFVRDVLLLRDRDELSDEQCAIRCRFGMRFQQLTGPVMAKGLEDTAFYVYNRLVALNEVGGDPAQFGTLPAAFHRQNADRKRRWPHALLTSSTHDTKRSEDVRARIAVLSELPREWRIAINRWTRLNRKHKSKVDGSLAPSRNDEYLLYQTLLGAWPFAPVAGVERAAFVARMRAYLEKATREAQVQTSWINPNAAYDEAVSSFVGAVLDDTKPNPFLDDFASLRDKVAVFGAWNALSQQVLKLTSPGVPDVYQGTELWDLSLVDPDNRRPVDYGLRTGMLRDLLARADDPALPADLVAGFSDGRIKLHVTHRALAFRRDHPDLFTDGDYLALDATGPRRDHVVAFARRLGDQAIVVVVPRLVAGLTKGNPVPPTGAVWDKTTLPVPDAAPGVTYRNLFTGETVTVGEGGLALGDVLGTFPVAVLVRSSGDGGGGQALTPA
ncbi:MAG: GH13_26 / GH13 [uncultured Thermomicrobiales bacterium]|uniref:GH13_26 / GH13 n=1 Tax=uncultured Thermomicrobiales bacterium TaxID=1645740 RepID=A0A6J4V3N0_9BACT|nr:MAG: GH13_26 / GH13 [uncultured Thermomicrobiales bacterium]